MEGYQLLIIGAIVLVIILYMTSMTGGELTEPPSYSFYQGKDSKGNNINRQESLANNVPGLQEWCNANPTCKGFHTGGWMKHTIKPEHKWKSWGASDPNKGLYVKN